MRFKTKKQQKEHVSGYGLWEDFNCFILRLSSINVTEKNILLKHATEKSNVRIISGKTKLAETDLSDKTFTLCALKSNTVNVTLLHRVHSLRWTANQSDLSLTDTTPDSTCCRKQNVDGVQQRTWCFTHRNNEREVTQRYPAVPTADCRLSIQGDFCC